MTTLIVDYGLCNLDSVRRALERCGGKPRVSDDPEAVRAAGRIVVPGVGNFADASARLRARGMGDALREAVARGAPLLGICLGMQLLASEGTEGGPSEGLDLVPGRVVRLQPSSSAERVPHVGWNEVELRRPCAVLEGVPSGSDFYFVHSYRLAPTDEACVVGSVADYGGFAAVVQRENVIGTQFHPEKSQRLGVHILERFVGWRC